MKTVGLMHEDAAYLGILHERLVKETHGVAYSLFPCYCHAAILERKPDLLFISMPFGDEEVGWRLIDWLRITAETAYIPLILCTQYSLEMEDRKGFFLGKKIRLIFKPLNLEDLLQAMQQAILLPVLLVI